MNYIFHLLWVFVLYDFGVLGDFKISVTKRNYSCKDDNCMKTNSFSEDTKNLLFTSGTNYKVNVKTKNTNLKEKNIYFVANSEETTETSNYHTDAALKYEEELTTSNSVEETLSSMFSTEELLDGTTSTIEVSKITNKDVLISTPEPNITTVSFKTVKGNPKTTQVPFTSQRFSLRNNKENICFCDLLVDQCDINCCCDEDCTPSHFKVFTKCIDTPYMVDMNYCYKTNFIFRNNTSHKLIQSNGGLFCIVRNNLNVDFKYNTKSIITTLEAFNHNLKNNLYVFSYKTPKKIEFINKNYLAGSQVWSLQNGELTPFKIPYSTVGFLCNSQINIKYLVNDVKICIYQQQRNTSCGGKKIGNMLHHIRNTKIISDPRLLNITETNVSKICKSNTCIGIKSYLCQSTNNGPDCDEISGSSKNDSQINCAGALTHIQYQIWHNGSEGIVKMEAYLWVKKLSSISDDFLSKLITEVKYIWVDSTKNTFQRSGNPGYITGKPILAGRKVYNVANGTSDNKEAIELSLDSKDWLSVLGSVKGICSSEERVPINFRENGQYMCSLKLSRNNFTKENCAELQNNIFKLLIQYDITNQTKENYFNKFVATFGNSKVENTGDWVQVLIDLIPVTSSHVGFKSDYYHLSCRNIITDLYVNVIYSKIGSFLAPQAKILGVLFYFGKHKDLNYYCDTPGCANTSLIQHFKLSSNIRFVDVTKPAVDAFAEPLSLEAKLPHDFFYPFFSKGCKFQCLNLFVLILFLSICSFDFALH